MSAAVLSATFLSRSGSSISEYDAVPIASSINFHTDVRQYSGAFDFNMEFTKNEKFPLKSHDFVEFWYTIGGQRFQVGVGFLETFVRNTQPGSYTIQCNGRELIGQTIDIPFKTGFHSEPTALARFVPKAINGLYLPLYTSFRGVTPPIVSLNSYTGPIQIVTDDMRMRGATMQEYAELVMNLIYQSRHGQVVLYGRNADSNNKIVVGDALGTLTKDPGSSNVTTMSIRTDYSKVISEMSVFYTDTEANVAADKTALPILKNTDQRASSVYRPQRRVFSATDIGSLVGAIDAKARMRQVGMSAMRKSNQDLGSVVVTTPDPFFAPPNGGSPIGYELMQNWRIVSTEDGLDQVMTLVGISHRQSQNELELDLAFVEPDTLV